MTKLFLLLLPALNAAANNSEAGKYAGGGFVVFIVVALLSQIPYSRLEKKLKNVTYDKNPPMVQNELDYADYLQWAAQNGQAPYFNKMSIDINAVNEDDE